MTTETPISLSVKEKKVISALYIEGKTIPKAATHVYDSPAGIKRMLQSLREKCGLESNKQILHFLIQNNLI